MDIPLGATCSNPLECGELARVSATLVTTLLDLREIEAAQSERNHLKLLREHMGVHDGLVVEVGEHKYFTSFRTVAELENDGSLLAVSQG